MPPTWSIPVDPLGFTAPGAIYLGARNTLVSLDFLDEDHLLFTFRVPGLLHRDTANGEESDERQIRAVVLTLPQGAVEAEAQWTVHDRVRYLWTLKNGHFLLRDRNNLLEGDATLELKPFLDFPGPLLWLELDPAQQFLVTNSREPVAAPEPAPSGRSSSPDRIPAGSKPCSRRPRHDRRTGLRGDDNSVPISSYAFFAATPATLCWSAGSVPPFTCPSTRMGYLENLRGRGKQWMLNLNYFTGGTRMLGSVDTACEPDREFSLRGRNFCHRLRTRRREQAHGHDHRWPHTVGL